MGRAYEAHYILSAAFVLSGSIMTIFRTRYRDPNERRWISEWSETRVAAELCRAEIDKRFAPRKVDVQIERFELNPGKSDVVRFLNKVEGE